MKRTAEESAGTSNDIEISHYYKRDVDEMSSKIASGVNQEHLQLHFYMTLRKYNIRSGLSMQLNYNNSCQARDFTDHNYIAKMQKRSTTRTFSVESFPAQIQEGTASKMII